MIVINGDLLKSPLQFIAHQVNCRGAMGSGLAKQIKLKYPHAYMCYKENLSFNTSEDMLGFGEFIKVDETAYGPKYVINIYAQNFYGHNGCYTDYYAFESAWRKVIADMRCEFSKEDGCQLCIGIPYKIGCGLAGGDWNVIKDILERIEKTTNVLFIAYKLEG